jgi:hypothetical protein
MKVRKSCFFFIISIADKINGMQNKLDDDHYGSGGHDFCHCGDR